MYLGFPALYISQFVFFVLVPKVCSFPLNISSVLESAFKDGGTLKTLFKLNSFATTTQGADFDSFYNNGNSSYNILSKSTNSYMAGNNGFNAFSTTIFPSIDLFPTAKPTSSTKGSLLKDLWDKLKPSKTTSSPKIVESSNELYPDPPKSEFDDSTRRDWPMRSITIVGSILAVSLLVGLCILTAKSVRNFAPLDLTAMAETARTRSAQTQMTTSLTNSQSSTPDFQETLPSAPPLIINSSRPEFNRVNSLPSYSEAVIDTDTPKLITVPEEPPPSYSSLGYHPS